jgi:hypothetical protein
MEINVTASVFADNAFQLYEDSQSSLKPLLATPLVTKDPTSSISVSTTKFTTSWDSSLAVLAWSDVSTEQGLWVDLDVTYQDGTWQESEQVLSGDSRWSVKALGALVPWAETTS